MTEVHSLLTLLGHANWVGRSLMQEARLSNRTFQYHAVALPYPWALQLSFTVAETSYTLRIARKMLQPDGRWLPITTAELSPSIVPEHTRDIAAFLTLILIGTTAEK